MKPLSGIKATEMVGLGPAPYCGMILADFGADVVIVDRLFSDGSEIKESLMKKNLFHRGKRSVRIDLKSTGGNEIIKKMIAVSDVLIEPYRPGVMESLGIGPEDALKINPRLIYARLTGWGQNGQYAKAAGHDINYIALSGALSMCKRIGERPLPPSNILGDFAAGGMLCAMGILLALIERNKSGRGQVIDSSMVDGATYLITVFYSLLANGFMTLNIGSNMLDGGAHYYQVYETADRKFIAVGAIEGKFYNQLLNTLELDELSIPAQNDMRKWPEMKVLFADLFMTKTRDEWMSIFEGQDACVTPVLELDEVNSHPHNFDRKLLVQVDGVLQPSPAPRLSRTPAQIGKLESSRGASTRKILKEIGYSRDEIENLLKSNFIR
jgi:alpha-methylacyl-CoA racemase